MAWKTSGGAEVVDLGLAAPGEDVFAPEEEGEVGVQARGGPRDGGADEFQRAQLVGEIGQQQRELLAVADGQGGAKATTACSAPSAPGRAFRASPGPPGPAQTAGCPRPRWRKSSMPSPPPAPLPARQRPRRGIAA